MSRITTTGLGNTGLPFAGARGRGFARALERERSEDRDGAAAHSTARLQPMARGARTPAANTGHHRQHTRSHDAHARGADGGGRHHNAPQLRAKLAALADRLAKLVERLDAALDRLADRLETQRPGGGAADPSKPSTAAGQPFRRLLPSAYPSDGATPSGADRPSARAISNAVSAAQGDKPNSVGASDMFWAWGQFLDHDLDSAARGDEAFDIAVPAGDPAFDPEGTGDQSLHFTRSEQIRSPLGRAQQINEITALMDASNVYGSDAATTARLRSFEGGRMREDAGFLPSQGGFFIAGDARANENPALTALHTVFVREHNRLADAFAEHHPTWCDAQIFEKARAIVTAQIQAITVNEFLPILLGPDGLAPPSPQGAGDTVDAQISNAFAAAAFRFGHTMVSDSLRLIDDAGQSQSVKLADAFFNPALVRDAGLDDIFRGLAAQQAQAMDTEIVDSLRNLVLEAPDSPRLDLAALNIQRGRDHGLPTLNEAREALGLERLSGFDDPRLRDGAGARLASVYDSIDDVDLWVGLLSERPVGGGLAGETQALILKDQFERTRDGDPNWYTNRFPPRLVAVINTTTLSDLIARNTAADDLAPNAMRVATVSAG